MLLEIGFTFSEVQRLPLDVFFLHVEGAKRLIGHRRQQVYVDTCAAIGGVFTKNGANEYLAALQDETE